MADRSERASRARRTFVEEIPRGARPAVTALFFGNGFGYGTWVAHLPSLKARFALGDGTLGIVLLAAGLAAIVALPIAGAIVARFGSRIVCAIAAPASSLTLVLAYLAPAYAWLIGAAALIGTTYGAWDVGMNAQAVVVERGARRPIMSSFHAFFSIGGLAGAALSALLLARGGTALGDVTIAAVSFGIVALAAVPSLARDDRERSPAPRGGRRARAAAVTMLGVVAFFGLLAEGSVGDWSAIYVRASLGASAAQGAFAFGAFSIAMACGRAFGDRVVARFGKRTTLVAGASLAAVTLVAALVRGDLVVAYVAFAGMGLGLANVIPILFSAAGRVRNVPAAVGIAGVSTFGYAGLLLGPPAIGFTADAIGLRLALGIVVACVVAIAAVAPRLELDREPADAPTASVA